MKPVKLSIITINYNDVNGLKATFKSVFEQTVQDFEYIVIDGGSNDGSRELIEQHAERISYWVSEPDKGIYNAINKGILKATGEYVLCLNSGDCFYDKRILERALPLLSSKQDIIYGNAYCFNFIDRPNKVWQLPTELSFNYFTSGALCHQATFIKRELFEKIGLYDESFKIVSDWFFTLKAIAFFSATYKHIDMIVCSYDKSGISATALDVANAERSKVLNQHFEFFYKENFIGAPVKSGLKTALKERKYLSLLQRLFKAALPHGVVWLMKKYKNK